jgi:hypothetical protein
MLHLNRRALHGTKGAEYAAVTRIGAQQSLAVTALVEELAGVSRHGLLFGEATMRADQDGLNDNNSVH